MTGKKSVKKIPLRYLPKRLTQTDKKKQASMLKKSRKCINAENITRENK